MSVILFSTDGGLQIIFDAMKKWSVFILLFFVQLHIQPAFSQATQPPFAISLEEMTYDDWSGLHSFAYGKWDNRWIIVCGRADGLHAFLPPDPFPVTDANHFIRMYDPATGEQWSESIYNLPLDISNQLRSANPQYFQRDNYLYVIGGYGKDSIGGNKITFPSLIAIDLDMLDDILMNDEDPSPAFRKLEDSLFQVCGGEIEILDDEIYLFGGHNFTGSYTKPATPSFTQQYTNALRKFKLNDDGTTLSISDAEIITDTILFHRRDLNFEPIMFPDEEEGLAVYSGVFQHDGDFPWLHNIYFNNDGTYFEDISFQHKFNNYTCPVLSVFDSSTNIFYATFFGGMSQYYFNEGDSTIEEDLNIPFINDITTLIRYADGTSEQIVLPISFDALLGSNAIFNLNETIAHYHNGIIKLHELNGEYDAGYIYGGIKAFIPNFTPSIASNRLFKVKIKHLPLMPEAITDLENAIYIYPNPANDFITIENNSAETFDRVILQNTLGEIVVEEMLDLHYKGSFNIDVGKFTSGVYFLKASDADKMIVRKIIIE
ncbi:MAG: T9SS type A sorting domain-containing protein [Fimbriimonadaceae bacterium]|nr:T9SS type A sorting domain-containing protein [Chitinophagales bacterium]